MIPDGISFGDQVLVVPGYISGFTHSAHFLDVLQGKPYVWLNRGDTIAEMVIEGSPVDSRLSRWFSSSRHVTAIRAPASGLLLHTMLKHAFTETLEEWSQGKVNPLAQFALLLPDDEPPAEDAEYLYGDACRMVRRFAHYYRKPSRSWTMKGFSDETIDALCQTQLSANPKKFEALPEWRDYLDEARIKKTALRPYLKHLA